MDSNPQPALLRIPAVARELAVTAAMTRKLIRSGALPASKIGAVVVVKRKDLEAFIEALPTRSPGQEPKEATRSSLVRRKRSVRS